MVQYGIPAPFDSHFLVLTLAITLAIQLSVWAVSAILRCESGFDAAGAVNYVFVAILTFALSGTWVPRQGIATAAVVICRGWLGIFLFIRVLQRKGDVRFEEYRKHWWQVRSRETRCKRSSDRSACDSPLVHSPTFLFPPPLPAPAAPDCVCAPSRLGLALRNAVHRSQRRAGAATSLMG